MATGESDKLMRPAPNGHGHHVSDRLDGRLRQAVCFTGTDQARTNGTWVALLGALSNRSAA